MSTMKRHEGAIDHLQRARPADPGREVTITEQSRAYDDPARTDPGSGPPSAPRGKTVTETCCAATHLGQELRWPQIVQDCRWKCAPRDRRAAWPERTRQDDCVLHDRGRWPRCRQDHPGRRRTWTPSPLCTAGPGAGLGYLRKSPRLFASCRSRRTSWPSWRTRDDLTAETARSA